MEANHKTGKDSILVDVVGSFTNEKVFGYTYLNVVAIPSGMTRKSYG